ncbi:uncharacterized protein [Asterias amurensis]|uniref:uncharacterized protein n=1 Tax=Asterias amurensis TaxID=7602 RepID=UPI003AB9039D
MGHLQLKKSQFHLKTLSHTNQSLSSTTKQDLSSQLEKEKLAKEMTCQDLERLREELESERKTRSSVFPVVAVAGKSTKEYEEAVCCPQQLNTKACLEKSQLHLKTLSHTNQSLSSTTKQLQTTYKDLSSQLEKEKLAKEMTCQDLERLRKELESERKTRMATVERVTAYRR